MTGCEGMIGILPVHPDVKKLNEQSEIRYCGPDGKKNWEVDKSKGGYIWGPKWDRLCGKANIEFVKSDKVEYETTKITEVEIFKKVGHFKGQAPKVKKDESPTRRFIILGTLKLPKRWYYSSTIHEYLIEEMSKVGANAILEYHTYQDSAMIRKNEITGEMLNVYRMNIEAKLIRYTD
jgi:hypothetical protein